MKRNTLSVRKMLLIALPIGLVVGAALVLLFPPKYKFVKFEVNLAAPADLRSAIVLTQAGRSDTTLGTYDGDQTIVFRHVKVLRQVEARIAAVPSSRRAISTPTFCVVPSKAPISFRLDWLDVQRMYRVSVTTPDLRPVVAADVVTSPDSIAVGRTDTTGVAEIVVSTKPGSRFRFTARSGEAEAFSEAVDHGEGEPLDIPISLTPTAVVIPDISMALLVRVVSGSKRTPVRDVRLTTSPLRLAEPSVTPESGEVSLFVRAKPNTRFVVNALKGEVMQTSDPLSVLEGATPEVTFEFPDSIRVVKEAVLVDYRVRVVQAGRGIPGVNVSADPAGVLALTGSDGLADLALNLREGTPVRFYATRETETKSVATTHVRNGRKDFTIELGAMITVDHLFRIINKAGQTPTPLPAVRVTIKDKETDLPLAEGTSGKDGTVRIRVQAKPQAQLAYEAVAGPEVGLDCGATDRIAGAVTQKQSPQRVEITFQCQESIHTPPEPQNQECGGLQTYQKIRCLYEKKKYLETTTADISGLIGEMLFEARFYRGRAFTEMDKYDEALREYEEIVAGKSLYAGQALLNQGTIYMSKGELKVAMDKLRAAEQFQLSNENRGLVHFNIGVCEYRLVPFTKQKANLIADARQRFGQAKDLLCTGANVRPECSRIDKFIENLDAMEK